MHIVRHTLISSNYFYIYIFLAVYPPSTQKGKFSIYRQPTGTLQISLNIQKYII